jgi:DNA-binding PadR family transcriptional regulator
VIESTWATREFPILEAISTASETGDDIGRAAREAVPELSIDLFQETLNALARDDYLDAQVIPRADRRVNVIVERLTPKGRRAVGQWPSDDSVHEFASTLARLEATEIDPVQKSRFKKIREAFTGLGEDLAARMIAEYLKTITSRIV